MDWNIENIETIVIFINAELRKDRTMTAIEKEDFNVNARVIHKRLLRLGYKKIDNQYIKEEETLKDALVVTEHQEEKKKERKEPTKGTIKEVPLSMDIEIDKLKELLELVEPIKELLKRDKGSIKKNINNNLEIPIIKNVKQRTVKIDIDVLKDWDKFIDENSNYKAQDLISQALKEFMKNHKK